MTHFFDSAAIAGGFSHYLVAASLPEATSPELLLALLGATLTNLVFIFGLSVATTVTFGVGLVVGALACILATTYIRRAEGKQIVFHPARLAQARIARWVFVLSSLPLLAIITATIWFLMFNCC
ncbi:MAG: hypothetical protein SF053_16165 [Bacteroidia bacterium]|nr:hypothetical protein [Bacteroidia bacterium]